MLPGWCLTYVASTYGVSVSHCLTFPVTLCAMRKTPGAMHVAKITTKRVDKSGQPREYVSHLGLAGAGVLLAGSGEQQAVQRVSGGRGQGCGVLRSEVADLLAGLAALERSGSERFRPAAGRVAELSVEERDDRVRDVIFAGVCLELGWICFGAHECQRKVTDGFGCWRHLDDVSENLVGRGVHILDLLELVAQAQRDRLLAKVG